MRTAPLAALTSKADWRVTNKSRRKASWAEDSTDAGGNTSLVNGAADTDRPGGAGTSAGASSSNTAGHGRPGLDKSRSTVGGDDDAAGLLAADEKAARENVTGNPRNKSSTTHKEDGYDVVRGKNACY